jgi:hypothetical protein
MRVPRLRLAALALTGGIALSGCAYDMYGNPYGYGYGPQSGVSVGVGYGGYYGGYYPYAGYGYGYPYAGYGYGYDPFGWYGDYYYPGVGVYVYDHNHNRHQWTDQQRRYWEQRRSQWQSHHGSAAGTTTENWSGWDRSRWRNQNPNAATTTQSTDPHNWYRGNGQNRSSVTTNGERVRNSATDRHPTHRQSETQAEKPQ